MVETPEQGARRLASTKLSQGFRPAALHCYADATGEPLFWRIRLKHPSGDKWMRPMHWTGTGYAIGEPDMDTKPLYRLPELLAADPALPVYVVEGEGCADALARLGIVATTSGSSSSADAADWTALQGHSVRIWPDNDDAGATYADGVAAHLLAIGCAVDMVDVAALVMPDKGDCVDWLALHPDATAGDVLSLPATVKQTAGKPRTANKIEAGNWLASAPEPLRRPLAAPEPYPVEALGEVLGDAVKRVHAVVRAPLAICGQSFLSAASLAAQAHADVVNDGRHEPISLWHVTVAESGERKSGADSWALRAHREVERELADAYGHAMVAHELDMTAFKAAEREASSGKGKRTADDIRAALHKVGAPPLPPLAPWLLVPEATLEGLHKLFQNGRPSLGLFNDDAGDFLDGHAMSRDNKAKSAAGFSKLWDSGEFSRIRAGDGAAKFYGRRLAMHVMVQPVIAERVLSDDVLCKQGFLPRALLAWPTGTAGTRMYDATDLSADPALVRYWSRMRDLLTEAPNLRQGTRNELEPRALSLAPDAKSLWVVRAWAGKAASNALRIAGVLTLVEQSGAGVISRGVMERAAELQLWHLREAARIVGTASVPPHIRRAELLLEWCRDTRRALLYSTDAVKNGPNAIRNIEAFTDAVEVLEATGWAMHVEGGMELDGRHRARVWHIRAGE
jgi:hypothetical protein